MLPILAKLELEQVDRTTIEVGRMGCAELMEQAGKACAERIIRWYGSRSDRTSFVVLAGWGNNGGDGLVIARLLHEAGLEVRVLRVFSNSRPTPEFEMVLGRVKETVIQLDEITEAATDLRLSDNEVVIDCLFGRGLNRAPAGWLKILIQKLNASGRPVIAIDQPSGVIALEGEGSLDPEACVQASHTLVIELPKLSMLSPETGPYFGRWELVPIGLDPNAILAAPRIAEWVEFSDVMSLLKGRPRFGHKGTFGHAALIAGSRKMSGAAVLATKGCLKSGVGLCTVHGPEKGLHDLMRSSPDAMGSFDQDPDVVTQLCDLERFTAVGVGPGLGGDDRTRQVVRELLQNARVPLVLDADALNAVSQDLEWLGFVTVPLVLTPHPKEMDRLLGKRCATSWERLKGTRDFASVHHCHVVLKGAYTAICSPDGRIRFNSTGNVGMAKGGSGDVLTGVLTGLLAQGYAPEEACLIGVYLHGLAGDLAAEAMGADAMRASDLVTFLPNAWKMLRAN